MITLDIIASMTDKEEFMGSGYLGHYRRTLRTDEILVFAANKLNLSENDIFLWANSKYGEDFMDGCAFITRFTFEQELSHGIRLLKFSNGV
jgi:hypothetical protein